MPQSSSSVRFPHSRQKRTRSLTSAIAAARASASSFGTRSRWNASRCAVRCPTPGSRVSCATRFSTAGLNTAQLCLDGSEVSPDAGHETACTALVVAVRLAERGLEQPLLVAQVDDVAGERDDEAAGERDPVAGGEPEARGDDQVPGVGRVTDEAVGAGGDDGLPRHDLD